jgi:hypothetical protein
MAAWISWRVAGKAGAAGGWEEEDEAEAVSPAMDADGDGAGSVGQRARLWLWPWLSAELRRWKREERNNGLLLYALFVYVVMYFVLSTVQ